jgi:hypothetical protein
MHTLQQPIFVVVALMFVAHQILQKYFGIALFWLHSYLDPLLCMPILLTLLLTERRHIWGKGLQYRLSLTEVSMATIALSIVFELVFPKLSTRFTADWGDVVAYAIGALFFYLTLNHPLTKS